MEPEGDLHGENGEGPGTMLHCRHYASLLSKTQLEPLLISVLAVLGRFASFPMQGGALKGVYTLHAHRVSHCASFGASGHTGEGSRGSCKGKKLVWKSESEDHFCCLSNLGIGMALCTV